MKSVLLLFTLLTRSLAAPQVRLGSTLVTGSHLALLQQDFFAGIPFAEAPVGKLRLQPSILKTQLGVRQFNATHFGFACIQPGLPTEPMSEDCLTINVLRPSGISPNTKLPVLFWTYGGGFQSGSSAAYNGSAIVAQSTARGTPVIYVNFNYRLGPLGFPQGEEAKKRGSLNLAIRDQITALEWVQQNIGYFGGDRRKVTVFGESAGAIMTAILFLGHQVERFARAAIFESGSAATSLTYDARLHENDWQNFVRGVPSCSLATSGNTFLCLQSANTSEITQGLIAAISESPEMFGFIPTIDGSGGVFPDFPSRLFAKGQFARLPFISGTNLDEGTAFVNPLINSEDIVNQLLIANYSPPVVALQALKSNAEKLIELYPDNPAFESPFSTANESSGLSPYFKQAAAIAGDLTFQSQRRFWMQIASRTGVKTYGYLFTERQPSYPPALGVFHGAELPFVYGGISDTSSSAMNLSRVMIDYWVSFATSLDPNDGRGVSRPHWEQYTPQHQALMQFNGDNLTMIPDDYRMKQINFINSHPLVWLH